MATKGHFRGMGAMVRDPVCSMVLDKESAEAESEHGRKTYYSCSAECQALFGKDPAKYGQSAGQDASAHRGYQT